jgi:hypothetical protein
VISSRTTDLVSVKKLVMTSCSCREAGSPATTCNVNEQRLVLIHVQCTKRFPCEDSAATSTLPWH